MNRDFASAMARASQATRSGDLDEATRIIRAAVGIEPVAPAPAAETMPVEAPASRGFGSRLRRPLREVVRLLKEGRQALRSRAPAPVAAPPVAPEGARFEARRFACAQGARDYKLYVPARTGAPEGLVLMLHGCRQNPDDFAAGTGMNAAAEREGLLVVYPRQGSGDNAMSCWNWFRPGDQRRDAGEPAILAGLTWALVSEFGIDPERVFVAGLSAGGAMAAVLAETYPDLFAAAGVHSGLPTGTANDVVSAFVAMRGDAASGGRPSAARRLIVFHGEADRTVHSSNARRIVAGRVGGEPSSGRSEGGRGYRRLADPDTELWLVEGGGHAWFGGRSEGSYSDPSGPDATAEMLRFFLRRAWE